jgi:hypothetical protein
MKNIVVEVLIVLSLYFQVSLAHGKDDANCKKTDSKGKVEKLEAKDSKECVAKGGKWTTSDMHNHEHEKGSKEDGHKHE